MHDFIENSMSIILSKRIWCSKTSTDPIGWSPNNPAHGQGAATALFIQDLFGGDVVWAYVTLPDNSKVLHYFNSIDGQALDVTRSQFPKGTSIPKGNLRKSGQDTSAYLLSDKDMVVRYTALCHSAGYKSRLDYQK